MQSKHIALTVILVAFAILDTCSAKNDFTIGHRQPGDEEIENKEEKGRGASGYVFNYSKTYVGNNEYVITQVVVEDVAEGGAYAAIIAGGPGHTFVTVAYTMPRHVDMNYRLTIYGKSPAFRKIP